MSTNRFPNEDQMVTAVTVRDGNASVIAGTVVLSKERGIAVRFEAEAGGAVPERDQTVTLLYGGGERVLRLRTRVSEVIDSNKVLLQPDGPIVEGERREFLRTESMLNVRAEIVGPDYVLPGETPNDTDAPGWDQQIVDLSGSGLSFLWDSLCKKGDLLFLQLQVPGYPDRVVGAIGEVVRAARDAESGKLRVAVHFSTVAEADRDLMINYVFKRYYEQLGSEVGTILDPDS